MKKSAETTDKYQDTEVLYLISLIKSAIRGEEAVPLPEVPDGLDWQRLYNVAKSHMVVALVYPCVTNNSKFTSSF